jgi:hypothetical protein
MQATRQTRLLGADVSVFTESGQGSICTVELPRELAGHAMAASRPEQAFLGFS